MGSGDVRCGARRAFGTALGAGAVGALLAGAVTGAVILPGQAWAVDAGSLSESLPTDASATSMFQYGSTFRFDLTALTEAAIGTDEAGPVVDADANAAGPLSLEFNPNNVVNLTWGFSLFGGDPCEYNRDLALASLTLCEAAKTSEAAVDARLADLGFEHIRSEYYDNFFTLHHPASTFASRAVTIDGARKVVVAIVVRGTSSAGDVFTDIGAVFNGFSQAATNLHSRFDIYYRNLSDYYGFDVNLDNTILYITGHSLGGAVAGQLAEQLEDESAEREKIFCYTFGSPNYDSPEHRGDYSNIHNIINVQDPWPYLPFGYNKNGHQWFYDSFDEQYANALDEIYGMPGWEAKSIEDRHDPPTYLALLLTDLPRNM